MRGERAEIGYGPLLGWLESLGFSVSTADDVNGDGYSDVIVGAPFFDNGHALGREGIVNARQDGFPEQNRKPLTIH